MAERLSASVWSGLLLLLTAAAVLGSLAVAFGMSRGSAIVAAGLWALNFHGIEMPLLWISGRTALLVTTFERTSTARSGG